MTQTRIQQIAAAASNYRIHEGEGVRGWEEAAFEAGARWADAHAPSPWISVNDEMPRKYKDVAVIYYTLVCEGKEKEYDYCAAFWNGQFWVAYGYNVQNARISTVTHWMPFPQRPNLPRFAKSPD